MPRVSKREKCRRAALMRASQADYDGYTATAPARSAAFQAWCNRVDPEGELPVEEREAKAKRLWQASMIAGREKSRKRGKYAPRRGA